MGYRDYPKGLWITFIGVVLILIVTALPVRAADFCVSDAAGFRSALNTAEANGENDTIKVVQGQYLGPFNYDSASGESITAPVHAFADNGPVRPGHGSAWT